MKMRMLTQIPGMILAVMLTLVVTQGLVFGPEAQAGGGRGLEGTWLNKVKIVDCDNRNRVFTTFESMTTFMRGGILIEGGARNSAGHGIWERTGPHTFRLFFRAHSFDDRGRLVSIIEVESHPRLIQGDNRETDVIEPYYHIGEGTNRITNFDPANGTVTVTHGCNEATSRPFFFEDLSEED